MALAANSFILMAFDILLQGTKESNPTVKSNSTMESNSSPEHPCVLYDIFTHIVTNFNVHLD